MGQPPDEQRERRAEGEILARVKQLVADEHRLREQLAQGSVTGEEEREALSGLERELDQCWDLLRQRRAKHEAGGNPAEASVRPSSEVEGYLS
ncbi:DUF2630 family protein [Streptomyces albiaxialis]|uniref:DUF2630 family protein n=1 Tax=Streptomyces albiaxialis TaxID=329523 RepID=A0ABP5H7X1_9ACTN